MTTKSARLTATAAAAVLCSVALGVGTAYAAEAETETVCSYWVMDDVYNVEATKLTDRSFRITIADLKSFGSPHLSDDRYIPMPLEPNLRLSSNVVALAPELLVSDVAISQSVIAAPSEDGFGVIIEGLNHLPAAPWESATLSGNTITWLQDMDARSDENGVQVIPSDYDSPYTAPNDWVGVLEFTVTVPDSMSGQVKLFNEMTVNYTSSKIEVGTGIWAPDVETTNVIPGCSVEFQVPSGPDPEGEGESETGTPVPNPNETTTPPAKKEPQQQQLAVSGGPSDTPWIAAGAAAALLGGALIAFGRRAEHS